MRQATSRYHIAALDVRSYTIHDLMTSRSYLLVVYPASGGFVNTQIVIGEAHAVANDKYVEFQREVFSAYFFSADWEHVRATVTAIFGALHAGADVAHLLEMSSVFGAEVGGHQYNWPRPPSMRIH